MAEDDSGESAPSCGIPTSGGRVIPPDAEMEGWVRCFKRQNKKLERLEKERERLKSEAGFRFPEVEARAQNLPVQTAYGPIQQPAGAEWYYPEIIPEIIGLSQSGYGRRKIYKTMYARHAMPHGTTREFIHLSSSYNPKDCNE